MESLSAQDHQYFKLLSRQFPTIQAASTEIIHLKAMMDLPKGTEHFLSDIHGEYEAFLHVLKNGSGSIQRKIEDIFQDTLSESEKQQLATLIYYPEQKISLLNATRLDEPWYRDTLNRLIKICRTVASKYTRAQIREALPEGFAEIISELLFEQEDNPNRVDYFNSIIDSIVDVERADHFITAIAHLIQRLAIARLHVIGDVYDRGPGAHIIMDKLLDYHAVDFQWGNHDIVWMGAAGGSEACLANVIRVCLRYSNLETLEDGYGISMLPLASFAVDVYGDDPCTLFTPRGTEEQIYREFDEYELKILGQMHKAITIIQLKLESQVILRCPEFNMADRLLLDKIDYKRGTIRIKEREFNLIDSNFPTIDLQNPFELSEGEAILVEKLMASFANSERLQKHVRFLYAKGGMYLIHNGNLLYHGCIPMNPDGEFSSTPFTGSGDSPRVALDRIERLVRQAYFSTNDPDQKRYGQDTIWYLWGGAQSPLFGKDKMATFERYFIEDEETHHERMNPYYDYRDKAETARRLLAAFGLNPDKGHIINGHVPVKVNKGESPVKAGGRLLVIDGGFAKAYQAKTGIAGYTLIFNSYGLLLAAHAPFVSTQKAIEEEIDIHSKTRILETNTQRIRVGDTDLGREYQRQIEDLKQLLEAYRQGLIKENLA